MPLKPLNLPLPLASLHCGDLLRSIANLKFYQKGKRLHAHMISSGVLINNTYLATKLCAIYTPSVAEWLKLEFSLMGFHRNTTYCGTLWSEVTFAVGFLLIHMWCIGKYLDLGTKGIISATHLFWPEVIFCLLKLVTGYIVRWLLVGMTQMFMWAIHFLVMYANFGEMELAQKLFDRMPERDCLIRWRYVDTVGPIHE